MLEPPVFRCEILVLRASRAGWVMSLTKDNYLLADLLQIYLGGGVFELGDEGSLVAKRRLIFRM